MCSPQTRQVVPVIGRIAARQSLHTGRREALRSGSLQIRQSPGKSVAKRLAAALLNHEVEELLRAEPLTSGARVRSSLLLKTNLPHSADQVVASIAGRIAWAQFRQRSACWNPRVSASSPRHTPAGKTGGSIARSAPAVAGEWAEYIFPWLYARVRRIRQDFHSAGNGISSNRAQANTDVDVL
jgi:hypothetical protein